MRRREKRRRREVEEMSRRRDGERRREKGNKKGRDARMMGQIEANRQGNRKRKAKKDERT